MGFVFCATTSCYGFITNAYNWQNFGDQTIYFLGRDYCPAPGWLSQHQQMVAIFAKPDSPQSITAVESLLEKTLESYEQDTFAIQGYIPLNRNPRCILGLYLAERFPETKVGDLGKRLFKQSVEDACLVAFGTKTSWKQHLEMDLMKTDENSSCGVKLDFLNVAEWPFVLVYFAENGTSEKIRQRTRKLLAEHCWERYGLAPALSQYRLLLLRGKYSGVKDNRQLEVAELFEKTGATSDAEELYGNILHNTNLANVAITAAENLSRIKLANSQDFDAWEVLSLVHRRFSKTAPYSNDLQNFFMNFQTNRDKKLEKVIAKFSTTQQQEDVSKLCQELSGLFTKKQAVKHWQHVVDNAGAQSLAGQFGQLYLAQSLVDSEKLEEAKAILNDLSISGHVAVRARALIISAEIIQRIGKSCDAARLYLKAAQIKRPTNLPEWFRDFHIGEIDVENLTAAELKLLIAFLRGYNELMDGNYGAAIADLSRAAEFAKRRRANPLRYCISQVIPSMLMLAYMRTGDYDKAEEYGLAAVRLLYKEILAQGMQKTTPSMLISAHLKSGNLAKAEQFQFVGVRMLAEREGESKRVRNFLSQVEDLNSSIAGLFHELHTGHKEDSESQLEAYASLLVYITDRNIYGREFGAAEYGLFKLLWQIKRQRVGKLLSTEYDLTRNEVAEPGNFREFVDIEPIMFAIQLFSEESFDQIRQNLIPNTPKEQVKGQMYRFAKFAQKADRAQLARMALDAAACEIVTVPDNAQLLKNIADMYLAGKNHHKAIEIYKKIVEQTSDSSKAAEAQLKIIRVYSEELKIYDKAVEHCQKFLTKCADSPEISTVEFLIGKLAYLAKDYAGAAGHLDMFQRKYPDNPQIGEAMMLAALSQMSEGKTQDAIARFTEIIQKYPENDLAARSKFLVGYAQILEQKFSQALEVFKQLVEQYPKSKYTTQAQSFIDRLSKVVE